MLQNIFKLRLILSSLPQPSDSLIPLPGHPRLALAMVLAGCVEGFLLLAALVCSSFSAVNLGTSKRSVLTPEGDERVLGVRRGNKLTARTGTLNMVLYIVFCLSFSHSMKGPAHKM